MTTKQSPEQSSSDPLDEIKKVLAEYKIGFVVGDKDVNQHLESLVKALADWHLQKCRSYLPEKVKLSRDAKRYTTLKHRAIGHNDCLEVITKRIEREK